MLSNEALEKVDPELWQAMQAEIGRQEDHIELIASENYASPAVLAAQGSALTNKYAEGYPGKRYYGGCEYVDIAEELAIDRAKKLFGAEYANVQPHSGSQANQAVYAAVMKPGDVMLGMSLAHGGHLTHGAAVNFSGKIFQAFHYGLDEDEEIDYDQVEHLAKGHRPKLIVAGGSAYSLTIDWKRFRRIADGVGAKLMADIAHPAGLVAAGLYPSPVGIADFVTTTTHKTLRGPRGGMILAGKEHEKALNAAVFPQLQGGPLMHVIAAKAVAFKEAASKEFRRYQEEVLANARVMAKVLAERGMRIVSGRTDCHLCLVDLRKKGITGKRAEDVLESAHITVNKNAIPNDPEKPAVTSGIRIGTPAVTTRGFEEFEAEQVANLIADVIDAPQDEATIARVREQARALCRRFPVYPDAPRAGVPVEKAA
ncbi:MAG TPA: serine hydroxymethyltransferase [Burkholderiales bacterium]|nr:serine hydroxymethyltransferase [Burkholderiales bacterium]